MNVTFQIPGVSNCSNEHHRDLVQLDSAQRAGGGADPDQRDHGLDHLEDLAGAEHAQQHHRLHHVLRVTRCRDFNCCFRGTILKIRKSSFLINYFQSGTKPSTSDAPTDNQEKNKVLLMNNEAINGVVLAIEAAISSVLSSYTNSGTVQLNSEKGLKAETIVNLIVGFHGALVTTIYSRSAFELAENILYIMSSKKIQKFTDAHITELKTQKSFLTSVIQTLIKTTIVEVQTEIKVNGTVETTEDDITKFTFPLKEADEASTPATKLSKVEILIVRLKAMLANLDGLKISLTAISTAIKSTSTSGRSETYF